MEMRDQYGVGECLTLGENDLLAIGRLRESIDATFGREAHDPFGGYCGRAGSSDGLGPETGSFIFEDDEDDAPAIVGPFEFVAAFALNRGLSGNFKRIANLAAVESSSMV